MKILYVGDVMAAPGKKVLAEVLPKLRQELQVDFVIVQAENSDDSGKGPSKQDLKAMQVAGVDFFTGGNHSLKGAGSEEVYIDAAQPITRPANLATDKGKGWDIIEAPQGKVLIVSLLGQIVGNRQPEVTNPLETIDAILEETAHETLVARLVNFHGDYSSEKRVIGYYLDGRVSAVIGDHWHVPTADALVLPKGTAHITDVGMCGTLHSSLGVSIDTIVHRWKTAHPSKNVIEEDGPLQFNAVLIDVDTQTGRSRSIQQIQRIID